MENYRTVSRNAWAYLAKNGCDSSLAYGPEEFKHARKWLDANGWIPWRRVHSVLCLACGGGQQALLFASLGHRVTLLDISPEQLGIDREVAERYGLEVECVEGDMQNLSSLYGRDFDLVYQAVSACYVPDVRRVYQEIFKGTDTPWILSSPTLEPRPCSTRRESRMGRASVPRCTPASSWRPCTIPSGLGRTDGGNFRQVLALYPSLAPSDRWTL